MDKMNDQELMKKIDEALKKDMEAMINRYNVDGRLIARIGMRVKAYLYDLAAIGEIDAQKVRWLRVVQDKIDKCKVNIEVSSKVWVHDCEKCVYLGTVTYDRTYDLYACEDDLLAKALGPSLIARYGDAPAEYATMSVNIVVPDMEVDCGKGVFSTFGREMPYLVDAKERYEWLLEQRRKIGDDDWEAGF